MGIFIILFDEFIQDILTIEEIYCRNIKDLKL